MNEIHPLLELRVLAGLQAGARLTLANGRHVLGSAEACDIVLVGPGIESQALVIAVDGVRLHLRPGQPGCGLVAGDSLSEDFVLEPGVPFHLGDIWLVVDHRSRPWPENRSWLAPMAPSFGALSMDAIDSERAAEVASRQPKPSGEPGRLLWWLKWTTWCIAVFCLGGLGILAWFKFGMEYFPHMQSMAAAHLSRLNDTPAADRVTEPVSAPKAVPAPSPMAEHRPQEKPASALVLLNPEPTTTPVAERPMLGLPLMGSHLVPSRPREQPERTGAVAVSTADLARLPFVIRQVDCGSVASIATESGVKLFEGARHKGYEFLRVSPERLRLRGHHDVDLPC